MSKPQAKLLWECGSCNEVHEDEDGARECCAPEVWECYGCPECEKVHDEEHKALSCCEELTRCPCCSRDYGSHHLNAFAVRVAGHCNTCNPFFSLDQQTAIEDQHVASGCEPQGLNS